MINWKHVYELLHSAGYTDTQIGEAASCTRSVVNRIRRGHYNFEHEPGITGALKLRDMFKLCIDNGWLAEAHAKACGMDKLLNLGDLE